ncbi:MAG: hypothetical protein ACRDSH_09345 [Pseudonocardiaceae bacterium]
MTSAVASASRTKSLPEVQAIMARCRQSSAAAATTAIDTFRATCSEFGTHTRSSAKAALLAATATNVSDFWATSESVTAALASEAASQLPTHGPDTTTQVIKDIYTDRVWSINRYFDQLTTEQLDT